MADKKEPKDFSLVIIYVALGVVIGGVAAVPLSKCLPVGWQATLEANGQIGDFVGGLLNPVIALLALYWLKSGVEMQRVELTAAKESLTAAAKAQSQQVIAAEAALQLDALTALINAGNSRIDAINREIKNLHEQSLRRPSVVIGGDLARLESEKLALDVSLIDYMARIQQYLAPKKADESSP